MSDQEKTAAPPKAEERSGDKRGWGWRQRPDISSMAEAVAYVERIIEDIRPFPEKIVVLDPAEFEGVLARITDDRNTLTPGQIQKMLDLRSAVKRHIDRQDGAQRIPELLLMADNGAVARIWEPVITQAVPGA